MTDHRVADIIIQPALTPAHFEQIILLQKRNHYKALSTEQQQQQGFVFAEHSIEMLRAMAANIPQVVALFHNKVIGYNLAMTKSMETDLPSLEPMFGAFYKTLYKGKSITDYRFFVGGQVCVDHDFRGLGLLSRLYKGTAHEVDGLYELCVTEISVKNKLSLKAHQKMGFEIAGSHTDEFGEWHVVVWDLRK